MANSYLLTLSDGTFDQAVPEDTVVFDHGLTFTGRGVTEYGEARNENILHLVENFANNTAPVNPLIGQMWFETGVDSLNVWNGTSWISVSGDNFIQPGTYQVDGVVVGQVRLVRGDGSLVIVDNIANSTTLNNHINVDNPAHAATAISFSATGSIGATNLQDAVAGNPLFSNIGIVGNTTNHIISTTAHPASNIVYTLPSPNGIITSSNVQGAIEDLDDELDDADTDISTVNSDLAAHIADLVDAHDASAISFIPVGGLTSTDVQAAIDEIFASAGSPGALETVRAFPSSTQAIGTTFTKVLFQNVDFGNSSGQYSVVTSDYTVGFDQEVNVTFSAAFGMGANDPAGQMEIRVNGVSVRNHQFSNFDNADNDSDVDISRTNEITAKIRASLGDIISCWIFISPANVTFHDTQSLNQSTFVEFEVVRVL